MNAERPLIQLGGALAIALVMAGSVQTGARAATPHVLDPAVVSRVHAVAERLQKREQDARSAGKSARAIALYRQNVHDAHIELSRLGSPRLRTIAVIQFFPYEIRAASVLALLDACGKRAAVGAAVHDATRFGLVGSLAADRAFEQDRLPDGFRKYRQLLFPAPGQYGFNAVFVERQSVANFKAGLDAAVEARFDRANAIFAAQDHATPQFRYPALFLGVLQMRTDPADAVRHFKKVLEIPSPAEPDSPGYDSATISALVLLASPPLNAHCRR